MNPSLIDTHAHLCFSELKKDITSLVKNAEVCGVKKIVNIAIGADTDEIEKALILDSYENYVVNAAGIHPNYSESFKEQDINEFENILNNHKIIAIGEVGLDYYRDSAKKEKQIAVFNLFVELAKLKKLPLIIHQRNSFDDVIGVLKDHGIPGKLPFVFHCFGGDTSQADEILSLGGTISLTGIITFKKASKLREAIKAVPLNNIMLETDCPFLSPEPHRGKRNEPSYVIHIAKQLAEIKNSSLEDIANQTTQNAKMFFNM